MGHYIISMACYIINVVFLMGVKRSQYSKIQYQSIFMFILGFCIFYILIFVYFIYTYNFFLVHFIFMCEAFDYV